MIVGVLNEADKNENRVAISPEIIKKLNAKKIEVFIEQGCFIQADFTEKEFTDAGALIKKRKEITDTVDVLLTVSIPSEEVLKDLKKGIVIGNLSSIQGISFNKNAFDLSKLPRNTRAQSMDVLSSQANIAGYKSVLLALEYYKKFMPMLMTAAGTVKPARVLILGVGVAGLQAIATAKRLGAVVEASDVRPSVKDQVESLGAKFVNVPYETEEEKSIAEGKGGYAQMMPKSWLDRQRNIISETIKKSDIVITTALVQGKKPPVLVSEADVRSMKPGSVIVDIAGGNCELTKVDQVINVDGKTIVGYQNLPSMLAHDASILYAKNLFAFLELIIEENQLKINKEDELVNACSINKE
jgi:NAD(P) transhydrogenase subunit alpha